jgi:hypothetical protein
MREFSGACGAEMQMAHTERAQFRFVVKGSGDGEPFIVAESLSGTLSILEQPAKLLAFDLPKEMSLDEPRPRSSLR